MKGIARETKRVIRTRNEKNLHTKVLIVRARSRNLDKVGATPAIRILLTKAYHRRCRRHRRPCLLLHVVLALLVVLDHLVGLALLVVLDHLVDLALLVVLDHLVDLALLVVLGLGLQVALDHLVHLGLGLQVALAFDLLVVLALLVDLGLNLRIILKIILAVKITEWNLHLLVKSITVARMTITAIMTKYRMVYPSQQL